MSASFRPLWRGDKKSLRRWLNIPTLSPSPTAASQPSMASTPTEHGAPFPALLSSHEPSGRNNPVHPTQLGSNQPTIASAKSPSAPAPTITGLKPRGSEISQSAVVSSPQLQPSMVATELESFKLSPIRRAIAPASSATEADHRLLELAFQLGGTWE